MQETAVEAVPTEAVAAPVAELPKPSKHPMAKYRLCLTEQDLAELVAELESAQIVGYDTETSGLDLYGNKAGRICGFCFSTAPFTGWYVPIRHEVADGYLDPRQLPEQLVIDTLRPLLERLPLVGFHTKFDFEMSYMEGILTNFVHDVFISVSLLGIGMPGQRSLKKVTETLLGWKPLEIHEVIQLEAPKGRKKPDIAFHKYNIDDALDYAASDADNTLQNLYKTYPMMTAAGLLDVYQFEMALVPVVAAMEIRGVPVDVDYLNELAEQCARAVVKVEEATKRVIWDLYGEEFEININSTPQLRVLFTEKLSHLVTIPNEPGRDAPKLTDKGALSLDGSVLEEMAKAHPWIDGITTYKGLRKLHSTFLSKIPKNAHEGRIHANFNQVGTETGRFSSSGPNLQQIPKDQHFFIAPVPEESWDELASSAGQPTEGFADRVWELLHADDVATPSDIPSWKAPDGRWYSLRTVAAEEGEREEVWESWVCRTRNSIRAKPGSYIVEADYSQIELRVFAGEAQEPALLHAFETGEDVHTRTASVINGIPVVEVTKTQRGHAKTTNFGIIYGATAKRISESIGIPYRDAEKLVKTYFDALPRAKEWIDQRKEAVLQEQRSRTRYGRIRSFEHLLRFGNNSPPGHKAMAEREGVNAIIQGTAADVMKIALVRLHSVLRSRFGDDAALVMTVHDSIALEVKDSVPVAEVADAIRVAMTVNPGPGLLEKQTAEVGAYIIPGYPPIPVDIQVGPSWGEGVEVEEDVTMDAPSVTAASAASPVEWVLELLGGIDDLQLAELQEFLSSRAAPSGGTLRLAFEPGEGLPPEENLIRVGGTDEPFRMNLAFTDAPLLRRIVGECRLRQTPGGLDARRVLAEVNDAALAG